MDNEHQPGDEYPNIMVPKHPNLPQDKHFSDVAPPGSVVIMQQPYHQIAALLGDIVATRYKVRGVLGVVTDGRTRDVVGCEKLCKQGGFTAWAKGIISCGTSTEGTFSVQQDDSEQKLMGLVQPNLGQWTCHCVLVRQW